MKRSITIRLGELAWRALAGEEEGGARFVPGRLVRAIHTYLRDKGSDRPGWRYPRFARDAAPTQAIEVRMELREELWQCLQAESQRQGITVEQLVNHAALYVVAEIDSGRATMRILDDLGQSGG